MLIEAKRVEKAYKQFKRSLDKREDDIITCYYGLDNNVRHSLRELGEKYGVTRERIRQIKFLGLAKLGLRGKVSDLK